MTLPINKLTVLQYMQFTVNSLSPLKNSAVHTTIYNVVVCRPCTCVSIPLYEKIIPDQIDVNEGAMTSYTN